MHKNIQIVIKLIDILKEAAKKPKNPCWKGYKQIGTKIKNGREVPNCVPIKRKSK